MLSKLGSLSIRMIGLAGPGYTERDRGYHTIGSLGQGASSEERPSPIAYAIQDWP